MRGIYFMQLTFDIDTTNRHDTYNIGKRDHVKILLSCIYRDTNEEEFIF